MNVNAPPVSRRPQSAPSFFSASALIERESEMRRSIKRALAQCLCLSRHYRCQGGGRASFSGLAVPVEGRDPTIDASDPCTHFPGIYRLPSIYREPYRLHGFQACRRGSCCAQMF